MMGLKEFYLLKNDFSAFNTQYSADASLRAQYSNIPDERHLFNAYKDI